VNDVAGFHMMSKVNVNGPKKHPVYKLLNPNDGIEWNFETIYLVDSTGKVTTHKDTEPKKLTKRIGGLLVAMKRNIKEL
jgi:glutathione peroxidase-family protein